jgi:hypothetical protein
MQKNDICHQHHCTTEVPDLHQKVTETSNIHKNAAQYECAQSTGSYALAGLVAVGNCQFVSTGACYVNILSVSWDRFQLCPK